MVDETWHGKDITCYIQRENNKALINGKLIKDGSYFYIIHNDSRFSGSYPSDKSLGVIYPFGWYLGTGPDLIKNRVIDLKLVNTIYELW